MVLLVIGLPVVILITATLVFVASANKLDALWNDAALAKRIRSVDTPSKDNDRVDLTPILESHFSGNNSPQEIVQELEHNGFRCTHRDWYEQQPATRGRVDFEYYCYRSTGIAPVLWRDWIVIVRKNGPNSTYRVEGLTRRFGK
jgi:hypothetical protein